MISDVEAAHHQEFEVVVLRNNCRNVLSYGYRLPKNSLGTLPRTPYSPALCCPSSIRIQKTLLLVS